MFKHTLITILALALTASVALAAAPASFDGYVKEVALKTGKAEKEVREEAIEALRKEGKYSDADLARIGRGEMVDFDQVKHGEMINLLKNSTEFKTRTGLAAVREENIKAAADAAFNAMKTKPGLGSANSVTVEFPKPLQSQWVDVLFQQQPGAPAPYAAVDCDFEVRVIGREFPPYGDTYTGTIFLNGKSVRIQDKALLEATARVLMGKAHRNGPALILRGHLTGERIAREVPPYGTDQVLTVTLEARK